MKILIIQEASRHEENKNFRECFCLKRAFELYGHSVDIWGLNHINFDIKPDWNKYDIIFNLENYDTTGWVPDLSRAKSYKILWSIDAHCRGVGVFNQTFEKGKYNLLLHSTRDFAIGKDRVWFPNAFDDDLIAKIDDVEKRHFIGFCGNYVNRKSLIDLVGTKFPMKRDIFVIGDEMVKAVNSYQIHFNKNIANDINYRSFETIGCSTALLTNFNPQYIKLGFEDMKNCILYSTFEEIKDKLSHLSENEKLLKQIQTFGHSLSSKHTYKVRVQGLLKFLKGKV